MTYKRSPRPIGDNAGTSINLVPRRTRARGMGDWMEDFDSMFGTNFSGGRDAGSINPVVTEADPFTGSGPQDPGEPTGVAFVQPFPGICKPANRTTLELVVLLQKQLNRVAQIKGFPKIAADGDIGPSTLILFRAVQGAAGGSIMGDPSSCMGVAGDVYRIGTQVMAYADNIRAPQAVSGPSPTKAPSYVNPTTGKETKVPQLGGGVFAMIDGMSTPMKLTLAGLAVGIGYFAFFDKPKRARR